MDETRFMNIQQYEKRGKVVWALWAVFAVVSLLATTALYFGSNIWFARRVNIDGPYALAALLITYFVPMLTIIIPIIIGLSVKLIKKHEVSDYNEK